MPVRFDDYSDDAGRLDLSDGTNARRVLAFLAAHPEVGFTPREVHEATGVSRGSVGPTLKRLETHGLVRHKGEYWAITGDDRLAAGLAATLGLAAVEDRFGGDWYGRNPDWSADLPDLDDEGDDG